MQTFDLIIFAVANIANFSIGLLSYLKNHRHLSHILFAALTFTLIGWTSANYLSLILVAPDQIYLAVQVVLFFVVLQNTFFFLFVAAFPGTSLNVSRKRMVTFIIFSLFVALVSIYPGFFKGYAISGSTIAPQASPFIAFFVLHTLVSIGGGIGKLAQRYRSSRGLARNQFKFLILASSVLLLIAPFTNFFITITFDITTFVPYGPIYTLVFASLIAYAMVRHRLLDFRVLAAKAFVYVLTLGFLASAYFVAILSASSLIFKFEEVSVAVQATYTLLALLLAFSFQPIKKVFDRLSNKIFFRGSYESSALLGELTKIFAEGQDITSMINHSLEVINRDLKLAYSRCIVFDKRFLVYLDIVSGKGSKHDIEVAEFSSMLKQTKTTIVEEMSIGRLKQLLSDEGIAVIVPLTDQRKVVGVLLLGDKQNGSIFDRQDRKMLGILSNEMAIAVESAKRFEEIKRFNETLQEKVDEATKQLRQKNERLRVLDQTKDDFISMSSHQLRTPLTSVKGYVSMVLDEDVGKINPLQRKLLNQSFVSAQRMVYLISDLLNVSRLRTGKFEIEPIPTNLATVIQGEVEQLQETAQARKLELNYTKPEHFPVYMLDETKLRQVIMNFIDNAIYYTPSGGKIEVALADKPSAVEFTVTDTGIGVANRDKPHMFSKYFRAHNAKVARPDGTGLGLFMAKKVIIAHGGAIIFKSREHKGSTFGFSLPKKALQTPPDKAKKGSAEDPQKKDKNNKS